MQYADGKITHELVARCCQEVLPLVGDAAEVGVYQGDSAEVICRELRNDKVWLFDTFEGVPADMLDACERHFLGAFRDTCFDDVAKRMSAYDNARLMPGVFPATARGLGRVNLKFVHVDADIYLSTLAALWWSWPNLVSGGIMLCDDYLCGSCPGAARAVHQFADLEGIAFETRAKRAIFFKD